MSNVLDGINMAGSSGYSMDQILQSTRPASQPSGFRKLLGGIIGGVGNIFMPGIGGVIGSAISGNTGFNQSGLLGDSIQYLNLQKQMTAEQEAFETASAVVKSRHDASMAAIRAIN
jgi:hypothetical protein